MQSAERLAQQYNNRKCLYTISVGEKVLIRIPRIDRFSSDLSPLSCIIVEVVGGTKKMHHVRYTLSVIVLLSLK